MIRILRSTNKKSKVKEKVSSELSVSKKSKTINRVKKMPVNRSKDIKRNDIWNINPILSTIFAHSEHSDLVEFNTVCKKWNHLTNPIIHRSLKLFRSRAIQNKANDKGLNTAAKEDAEVGECISNNSKFATFVKEFKFNKKLEPKRAIEFFHVFKFITHLTISGQIMSQVQFIRMMNPLTKLVELALKHVTIKKIANYRLYTEPIRLPQTLNKLILNRVYTIGNQDLFIQTINSHTNLKELIFENCEQHRFLDPFCKNYPSLKTFGFKDQTSHINTPQSIFDVFKFNQQLHTLNLELYQLNNTLVDHISTHLTNLEIFNLVNYTYNPETQSDTTLKLSKPTNLKKLNIVWNNSSSCSLQSALINCTNLEELVLIVPYSYILTGPFLSIDLINPAKIKKIDINCGDLLEYSLDSVLFKCHNLRDLDVKLPRMWKEWMKIIVKRCVNLKKLTIKPFYQQYGPELDSLCREFYESKLLASSSAINTTLTHLILYGFNYKDAKAEYFEGLTNLKSTKYIHQFVGDIHENIQDSQFNIDSFPGYKLKKQGINRYFFDIEYIKI